MIVFSFRCSCLSDFIIDVSNNPVLQFLIPSHRRCNEENTLRNIVQPFLGVPVKSSFHAFHWRTNPGSVVSAKDFLEVFGAICHNGFVRKLDTLKGDQLPQRQPSYLSIERFCFNSFSFLDTRDPSDIHIHKLVQSLQGSGCCSGP